MDQITESVLFQANIPLVWQGTVTKVDIDSIIEFNYGLDIVWENIDHLANNGIVLAAINPKRKIIYMNSTQEGLFKEKMGTRNFSLAHELGHWILHVTKQRDYEQLNFLDSDIFFCRAGNKKPPIEIQADMFAASLLMPKIIITEAIKDLKKNKEICFPDLYRLKNEFEVSISALVNRLESLGLLYIKEKRVFSSEAEANGQLTLF